MKKERFTESQIINILNLANSEMMLDGICCQKKNTATF